MGAPYRDPLGPFRGQIQPDRRRRVDITIALLGGALGAFVCFLGTQVADGHHHQCSGGGAREPHAVAYEPTLFSGNFRRAAITAADNNEASGEMGALTVVCMPKCKRIIDNGRDLGPGHIFHRPVPAGRHHLTLIGTEPGTIRNVFVDVSPNMTREVRQSMGL